MSNWHTIVVASRLCKIIRIARKLVRNIDLNSTARFATRACNQERLLVHTHCWSDSHRCESIKVQQPLR